MFMLSLGMFVFLSIIFVILFWNVDMVLELGLIIVCNLLRFLVDKFIFFCNFFKFFGFGGKLLILRFFWLLYLLSRIIIFVVVVVGFLLFWYVWRYVDKGFFFLVIFFIVCCCLLSCNFLLVFLWL